MRMALPSIPPTTGLHDIVVLDFEGGGRHLLIDVSVARPLPLLATWLGPPSWQVTRRTGRSGLAKLLAYGDVGHHRVVPFVLEEFGAMGPLTSAFFKECCRLREDRLDLEGQRARPMVGADLDVILASALVGAWR
eukprot:jgi/Mesvir1/24911/Mv16899-RA.1